MVSGVAEPAPPDDRPRCAWARNPLAVAYHDEEWGVPLHDEHRLFEFLVLEGAQAGLSWDTILKKRERYREVYRGFDPAVVAAFDEAKQQELLADPGIVRNKLKVASARRNARVVLELQREHGSLDAYLWSFVGGAPIQNRWRSMKELPVSTAEAEAMSKALKKAGMNFVGPTICYAFMQATGMVNDHAVDCFRHAELAG